MLLFSCMLKKVQHNVCFLVKIKFHSSRLIRRIVEPKRRMFSHIATASVPLHLRSVYKTRAFGGVARWGRRAVKCHGLAACLCDDVTLHQALLPEHTTAAVFVYLKPVKSEIHSVSILTS